MYSVRWQCLVLRGFGCYREEFVYEFPEGGLLVLPNESGKSTLVAGLAATIFGLPASTDPTKFGMARYRNWHEPEAFSGDLYFSAADSHYHLRRNFFTHEISLRQKEGEEWWELEHLRGIDNPIATRPLPGYRNFLLQTLGLNSLELYLAAFCLLQPLPSPQALDSNVQQLLAGAGSSTAAAALLFLENEVKALTRHYQEPLGRGRGGNKDRLLEQLDREIRDLGRQIEFGQAAAAELQEIKAELAQLKAGYAEEEGRWQTKENTLRALERWFSYAENYDNKLRQQIRLQNSWQRSQQLAVQLQTLKGELQGLALFDHEGLDWPALLEAGLQNERDMAGLEAEQEYLSQELTRARAEEEELLADYQAEEEIRLARLAEMEAQLARQERAAHACQQKRAAFESRFGPLPAEPGLLLKEIEARRHDNARRVPNKYALLLRYGSVLLALIYYWIWGQKQGIEGAAMGTALIVLGAGLAHLLRRKSRVAADYLAVSIADEEVDAAQELLEKIIAAPDPGERLPPLLAELAKAQAALESWQLAKQRLTFLQESGGARLERQLARIEEQVVLKQATQGEAKAFLQEWGGRPPWSWACLQEQFARYQDLQQQCQNLLAAQNEIWRSYGAGDSQALQKLLADAQADVAATRLAWQALIDKNASLPAIAKRENTGQIRVWQTRLAEKAGALRSSLAELQKKETDLLRRQAQLEGQAPLNIALAEERRQALIGEKAALEIELAALGLAYRELEAARQDFSANHRRRLAAAGSDYFRFISGDSSRRVELGPDFQIRLRGDGGQAIYPAQLSQGARDQLYLSLRLAIADFLATDIRLPLILDDPFVNCDEERLRQIIRALGKITEHRQIWWLTHRADVELWIKGEWPSGE